MVRTFALVFGIIFLAVGALGFAMHGSHPGMLLGTFPINGLHNLLHILIGVAGLGAYAAGAGASRRYAQVVGVVYVALGLLGFVSPSGFGMVPIGGADIALHLAAGAVALYFGFAAPRQMVRA